MYVYIHTMTIVLTLVSFECPMMIMPTELADPVNRTFLYNTCGIRPEVVYLILTKAG